MSSLSLRGGLDTLRRISFSPAAKPGRYFEPEDPLSPYPNVFINSIIFLEKYGLNEEGIMRVNGKLSDMNAVRGLLAENKLTELTEKDVHTVASVLKAFFTESPQPILPEEKHSQLVGLAQAEEDRERIIYELKTIISALPINLQRILHRFILFSEKIYHNSRVNKMEILSLAVILGPVLLRSPIAQGPSQQFHNNAAYAKIALKLMEYHDLIFEGVEKDIDKPKLQIEAIKSNSNRHGFKFVRGLTDSGGLKISSDSVPAPVTHNLKPSGSQEQLAKRSSGSFIVSTQDQEVKRSSGSFIASALRVEHSRRSSTGLVNISARTYYESLVNDMTIAYAAAKDNRTRVLHSVVKNAVNEWRRVKDDAIDQERLFSVVNDKYSAHKEGFDRAATSKDNAARELARLRALYLVSEENKWETQTGIPLLVDEIAHLQETQALVDLREAEFKLAISL